MTISGCGLCHDLRQLLARKEQALYYIWPQVGVFLFFFLKGISAKFQVIRGFSQKIPADLLSYDKIHS